MKYVLLVLACTLALPSSTIAARKDDPIPAVPVFITTAQTADGFTDPDKARRDSLGDLRVRLAKSKVVRLVSRPEEAMIHLEVLGRGTELDSAHPMTALIGGWGQKHSMLTVRLIIGTFVADFTGTSGPSGAFSDYGGAATKIVKDLEKWVRENRTQVTAAATTPSNSSEATP